MIDARCAINTNNDLTPRDSGVIAGTQDLGWNLPPNPDTARHLFEPFNESFIGTRTTTTPLLQSESEHLANLCRPLHDFTVEGWLRLTAVPASGAWFILCGSAGVNYTKGGWLLSVRNNMSGRSGVYFNLYTHDCGYDQLFHDAQGDEWMYTAADFKTTFLDSWHHVAIVFTYDGGTAGKSKWEFFLDGISKGTVLSTKCDSLTPTDNHTIFAGKLSGGSRESTVDLDYWRVSDEALAPSAFLNAGDGGTSVVKAPTSTVAYWKLGLDGNGALDTRDYVGNAHLHLGTELINTLCFGAIPDAVDVPFAGAPPNTTAPTADNSGSAFFNTPGAGLTRAAMGSLLQPNGSFTVEGWYKPDDPPNSVAETDETFARLFSVAVPDESWSLRILKDGAMRRFGVYAADDATASGGTALAEGTFSGGEFGPDEAHVWQHVALVYDASAGNGTWTLYRDGVSCGTVQNVRTPSLASPRTLTATNFCMGGTGVVGLGTGDTAYGHLDCVRLCAAALVPKQFLCESGDPQAATGVLAFWTIDTKAGKPYQLMVQDISGNGRDVLADEYSDNGDTPSGWNSAPVLNNPDRSVAFDGDAARQPTTATVFRNASASTGWRSYLVTADRNVLDLLEGGTRDFTFECYVCRNAAISGWQIFAVGYDSLLGADGKNVGRINFTHRESLKDHVTGVISTDCLGLYYANDKTQDRVAGSLDGKLSVGTWRHLAWTRHYDATTRSVTHSTYVDGELCGTVTTSSFEEYKISAFCLGGRRASWQSFAGAMSSVRLSEGVLAPSQFLCATPAETAPSAPPTNLLALACWPLDYGGAGLNLSSAVTEGYAFNAEGTGAAGQTEQAVSRIKCPDASPDFVGNPSANSGSIVLAAGGRLSSPRLGGRLEADRPFSVEGWVKWNGTSVGAICSTGAGAANGGWRLSVAAGGGLALLAQTADAWSALASGTFDGALAAGVWTHIALVYDPSEDMAWTLYLDGKKSGQIMNKRSPFGSLFKQDAFILGGGFCGAFDYWRVSQGGRNPDTFLFQPARGIMVILR